MAYQLEYEFREMKKSKIIKKKKISYFLVSALLAISVISARFGGATLEMLIWGKQDNILSAATEMANQLRDGIPLNEAVNVFCDEIVNE